MTQVRAGFVLQRDFIGLNLVLAMGVAIAISSVDGRAQQKPADRGDPPEDWLLYQIDTLQRAVADLAQDFPPERFPAQMFLSRLTELRQSLMVAPQSRGQTQLSLRELQAEYVRRHPLLQFGKLLVVKRRPRWLSPTGKPMARGPAGLELGMPSNHECNSSLARTGYDNELAILEPVAPEGTFRTLYRPRHDGYVGEVDLHYDGWRLLFTQSDAINWKLMELDLRTGETRQVIETPPDVDVMDACYLPDESIIFASTACFQAVPCWHGLKRVINLYRLEPDRRTVRRLCFDQDHDLHPVVLPTGQVLFNRWDYTGINHIYLRQLMVMNPDGTGQRAVYGSNSWFPNALYFARALPGASQRLVAILSGYHGPHRLGWLVLVDFSRGWYEETGIVARISGRGEPVQKRIADELVKDDWPRFLHPIPLSDKYFLVSCQPRPGALWGIYLADVFDNLILVKEEPEWALLEPLPLKASPRPPVVASRVDLREKEAVVYLHDIYRGPGLAGVPRGTIRSLRVIAYHFGYPGLAGPDVIGYGGPWEVMWLVGTVPLGEDGSAVFRVPANTPIAFQALDAEGKAVQLMRSWVTAMPGEKVSCVGCHEPPGETATGLAQAAVQTPRSVDPWYGPPRGFSFLREVQPVVNFHCVGCHDGTKAQPDLRPPEAVPDYRGLPISRLGRERMHPAVAAATGGIFRYAPAYEALIPYIRRVGIEDDVSLLTPGEYHADTSPLVQLLLAGHYGVRLDAEAWDRLVTWIDLNAPCHGSWSEVFPVPDAMVARRKQMWDQWGGPPFDPEEVPTGLVGYRPTATAHPKIDAATSGHAAEVKTQLVGMSPEEARARQQTFGQWTKTVLLPGGEPLHLVLIPPGMCTIGGGDDSYPGHPRRTFVLDQPLWMSAFEITNRQFRLFMPGHNPRYYQKRVPHSDSQGLPLHEPDQPVVRVSWVEAMGFCRWLSEHTGLAFDLPTEEEWEYAARAGSPSAFFFGDLDSDFSAFANLADISFGQALMPPITGGLEHLLPEGARLADTRFNDHFIVTAPVGNYTPNAWGLYDMHGNAAEWTKSLYMPARLATAGQQAQAERMCSTEDVRRVVRGGSFFTPPRWAHAAIRRGHWPWHRVFDVGFRVVLRSSSPGVVEPQLGFPSLSPQN